METLNDAEEQELLDGIKTATALVDDGCPPNDALAKVARDAGYGPGRIRLLGYAYNTGRQTAQREAGGSALAKLAAFDLIDPEAVVAQVYGGAKAAEAVHPDYAAPPDWLRARPAPVDPAEKAAWDAALAPEPAPPPTAASRVKAAAAAWDAARRTAAAAVRDAAGAEDRLHLKFARLVGYFKEQYPEQRLRFAVAAKAAADYFGPHAAALLAVVHAQGRLEERFGEKQAEDEKPLRRPLDLQAEPFATVAACVKLAAEVHAARARSVAADRALAAADAARTAAALPPPAEKTAAPSLFSAPAMGAMMGTMVSRSLGSMPTRDDKIEDAWLKLEDPSHANALRKIQAHAMLNSLLTDPDDPISGYDPDTVLEAYNDLAKLAPRAAQQPAAMGPLLRRRLSGQFEPFESKEVAEIEKSLAGAKASTPNTGKLSYAPDKIRG